MNVRKNVILASVAVAFILCVIGFVVAYRAYDDACTVNASLDGAVAKLKTIYGENPFPSQTNLVVLRNDTAWLANWYKSLTGKLRAAVVLPETPTPPAFSREMQRERVPALQKTASEKGCTLSSPAFAFGFDSYVGNNSRMPEQRNVRRLALQFMLVDAIAREIFDSHVTELQQIRRDEFEGAASSSDTSMPTRRHDRSAQATVSANEPVGGVADSRYPGESFIFKIAADEKSLGELLNRLAKMPLFVVVRDLSVAREKPGLQAYPEKAASEAGKTKAATLLPAQRMASGPEIAPLLDVQLRVDVYTFEGV